MGFEMSRTHTFPFYFDQLQLENLVPKLVSQATGRTSSVFGIVSQKPDWWPKYIDWIDPDQLCLRYEVCQ